MTKEENADAKDGKNPDTVSVAEMRKDLGPILDQAHYSSKPVLVTKRDRPFAAVVSVGQLELIDGLVGPNADEDVRANVRLSINKIPIIIVANLINTEIDSYREVIRSKNDIRAEVRERILDVLDQLQKLLSELIKLTETETISESATGTWYNDFKTEMGKNLKHFVEPKNVADAAVPTSIILGFGAIGSLLGGPVGFGAGSVFGHLITGQIKPGAAAKRVEDALTDSQLPDN